MSNIERAQRLRVEQNEFGVGWKVRNERDGR